jgi:hypothetical protein
VVLTDSTKREAERERVREKMCKFIYTHTHTQIVQGGKVSTLRGHSIDHSKQKSVYVHMSYSERFPI